MTGPFATATILVSLVLALWAIVLLIVNRPPNRPLLVGIGILEAMLIAFAVGGMVQMLGTDREFARLEFVGYLLGIVAIPPLAVWWVRGEQSRAAAGVLLVVLLVVPFLVIRVQQVWAGPGG
jgi:hypothetical protein